MKKYILPAVLLIGIIFVSGCVNQEIRANYSDNITMRLTNKTYDCTVSSDCAEGFHCFRNDCINNTVLNEFEPCTDSVCTDGACTYNIYCTQECENCQKGKMSCMLSYEKIIKDNLCVECVMNGMCKPGYSCEKYRCVWSDR